MVHKMESNLAHFTDILSDEIPDSQPMSLSSIFENNFLVSQECNVQQKPLISRPLKRVGQHGDFRSIEEIDPKYRGVFTYPFFNLVQSRVIEDALYSDKSMVLCAPTGSGKTVVFEMAIVQLLMEIEDKQYDKDFKIIYMAPVKALCTEKLTEWYSKFTKLGLLCIEVTGDTDVDFNNLKPYRVIITTPEKWDMMTRRWRDHRGLVELIKLFLIDEVHILNDASRGPVLEAVVSRMKTIESSTQSEFRIEQLQRQYQNNQEGLPIVDGPAPRIRFVAVSATVSNPEDVAAWLGNSDKPAVYYKFGDECRPVKLKRVVEGYPCPDGTSIFKFDIILNYKLWPIIQKYHDGKPTLIFCNTRKSVSLTAEALSREITISFNPEQRARLTALAATIKNKKLQALVLAGVGCHHAGLLFEERLHIETAFRNRDLPILITTTTLAMGVNLPAHLVIIKNTQQYVNGAYQEYSISTVLQMVGRAGRPQFDTEATAVIMTRASDKLRYEALVCGSEPLQSYLHKRLPENLNSEAALGTVKDVAQCVQWLRSTFLYVRAAKDPKRYLGLPNNAPYHLISKKIEELCVRAMNGLASAGLITMDEASCIDSTEAGRLMSIYYLDLETMKHIMKIEGTATLEQVLWVVCESHELADMHLRVDERRCLNSLNRNSAAATIRFPMKGKISTRQMKLNCVIQAVLGCLPIPDPSMNQEAMKIMRIADRVCKCLVAYVSRPDLISGQPVFFSALLNSLILSKCLAAHLWENSPYVSKQLKGIGPTFSTLLATAGKINFMLLEESHPRDLERIMNKGPPAGNVLRKQISLLPKYQITMTPVDENIVTMQLTLLNHHYLAENMENLTAGERHKCYIIAGDSENHLLLLTSFQDKDLIGMYDGRIAHEIKRKHNFEHTISIQCLSSKFVGIDAQCEYIFKDLASAPMNNEPNSSYFNKDTISKRTIQRQSCITDVYKERKTRNKCDLIEICQSKEKKKRESVLAEKIRFLKESFGKTTKDTKEELQKSSEISDKIVYDILNDNQVKPSNKLLNKSNKNTSDFNINLNLCDDNDIDVNDHLENVNNSKFESYEYIEDSKINDILKDIESEIYKEENNARHIDKFNFNKYSNVQKVNTFIHPVVKIQTKKPRRSNFKFMELLDRNIDFQEDDSELMTDTGFSNTTKLHINKYLQDTRSFTRTNNSLIENIIGNEKSTPPEKAKEELPLVKLDSNKQANTTLIKSNMDVILKPESEIQNEYAQTKEMFESTKSFPIIDQPIVILHTEMKSEDMDYENHSDNTLGISNKNLSKHFKNVSKKEKSPIIRNERSVNMMSIAECDNNRYRYDVKTIETGIDVPRQLEIENISDAGSSFPQEIYDNKQSVVSRYKYNDRVLSENYNQQHRNRAKYNGFEEINKTDSKPNYVRNFKFSALNVDVSTSHAENRHVHIIKKIKLDVNVTEIVTNDDNKSDTSIDMENALSHFSNIAQANASNIDKAVLTRQAKPLIHTQELKPINYFDDSKAIENNNKNAEDYSVTCPTNRGMLDTTKNTNSTLCALELKDKENTIQIRKPLYIANRRMYPGTPEIAVMKEVIAELDEHVLDFDIVVKNNDIKSDTHVSYRAQDNTSVLDKSNTFYRDNLFSKAHLLNSTTFLDSLNSYDVQYDDENINNNDRANKSKNLSDKENILEIMKPVVFVENKKLSPAIIPDKIKKLGAEDIELIITDVKENPKKKNTLSSILQKYSKVIRLNKNEDEKIVNTKLYQSNNEILRNEQRQRRPFKITNIDKVEQTLPPLLITEIPKNSSPAQLPLLLVCETQKYSPTQSKVLHNNKTENKVVSDIPTTVISEGSQTVHNVDIISEENLEHLTSTLSKDYSTSDYKIDDSMLNPKTLLQCLTNEETQIIPPPPEFRDFNYSPHQAAKDYIPTHKSIFQVAELDTEDNEFYNDCEKHDYIDFDNNQFQFNSSNKIKTLLLSNEDYTERKPWEMKQSPVFKKTPGQAKFTARAHLNKFKFKSKKKLKIN